LSRKGSKQRLLSLDERTGEVKLNANGTLGDQEDSELVLYALATVDLAPMTRRNSTLLNRLEYMCEIYVDLSDSAVTASPRPAASRAGEMRLVPSQARLKLEETLERDSVVFRFVSVLKPADKRGALVSYALVDGNGTFEMNARRGALRYYTLLEETNVNNTFYLSNHDGSLYLIKKLVANQCLQSALRRGARQRRHGRQVRGRLRGAAVARAPCPAVPPRACLLPPRADRARRRPEPERQRAAPGR
jgi:hypothetical protein